MHPGPLDTTIDTVRGYLFRRRRSALPLTAGEAATVAVAVVRGCATASSRAAGAQWRLTAEGRPVLVEDPDGDDLLAVSAGVLDDLASMVPPDVRPGFARLRDALLTDPPSTWDGLERRLLSVVEPQPIVLGPLSPVVPDSAPIRAVATPDPGLPAMLTALRGSSRNAQTAEGDAVVDLPARLDEFEAQLHAAGFAVERSLTELDELPRSLELTVLRVVQESVTNILKHAPRRGTVRLTSQLEGADRLVLCIASPMDEGEPRRDRVVVAMASGFGLAGMRERVAVFGGTLTAGPLGGCWVVRAELPLR